MSGAASTVAALLQSIERLIATQEAHAARMGELVEALTLNAQASIAVADSHAKLLAALLAPEEPAEPEAAPMDEHARMVAMSKVLDADGTTIG